MIKPNEFRVGNWFVSDIDDVTKEAEPMQIQIHNLCAMQDSYMYVDPIPLTEEWLLKLGFDKIYPSSRVTNEWGFKVFYSLNDIQLIRHTDGNLEVNIDECKVALEYVHQLQNLYFALTGEEL